ncbi:hypothetical protein PSN45_001026 [Yamadazyma tenuis]|uniref:uncharacterized protein n=1 Tax=Candida tenuis TaxID=2315449 RepID=UPI00279B9480|nr:hypothetical protein PSN45_001026 [Yamadazyma tenuis]
MAAKSFHPLVLQESWVLDAVVNSLDTSSYASAVVSKHFVRNSRSADGITAVVRVLQFLKVAPTGGITAVLTDRTHKILARFTVDAVRSFERDYCQRITLNTVNSLFVLKSAHLQITTKQELIKDYGNSFNTRSSILVLNVDACDVFLRDQVKYDAKVDKELVFVYNDAVFNKRLVKPPFDEFSVNGILAEEYDDMVSI